MWRDLVRRRLVREPPPSSYDGGRALELLRLATGDPEARFREGQLEAITHVVEGRGRLLVVQKTGWGKSFVYFIATRLLRESGRGPALLISPLLSLMRNQIQAAAGMGIRALTIHSDNVDRWDEAEEQVARDEVDILLISPERLANPRFQDQVLSRIASRVSLLVVDEAHCISDWGHDFRPHYRQIERTLRSLPANLRVLATTATANNRVIADLRQVLGPQLEISRGDLCRHSLTLQTLEIPTQEERLAWLDRALRTIPGSGIIYTLTVRDAEQVAEWLVRRGHNVAGYTSRSGDARPELEDSLHGNGVKALVATVALGMGYDKPDLSFVIHYQTPGSVVAYYQQVGRAGRALDQAYGILLAGQEDEEILEYFISRAFPSRSEVSQILAEIRKSPSGLSTVGLMTRLNISYPRIDLAIKMLALESPAPIAKHDTKWQLTSAPLGEAFFERADRLAMVRRQEVAQMREYVRVPFGGHMAFLIKALDGDPATATPPTLPPLPPETDPATVLEAIEFLRRACHDIRPRLKWPNGGMPVYDLRGLIPADCTMEPGHAVCTWGDGGWGRAVREGKYVEGHFSDDLVDACAKMVQEWNPEPTIRWVTAIPSNRHPALVPDLARRIAARLGLPFRQALARTDDRPEQKTMANSVQQARNVDGSLKVVPDQMATGPVLLVDDMVDSRWTLTVGSYLLRQAGSGPVFPLALATTGKSQ